MDIKSLFEARRNPEINLGMRSKHVLKQIEPYFGREDAFISMVEVPKIGVHPSTGHEGTPAGVYTYQLSEPTIWNQFASNRLPYMSGAKYVALVIAKPNIVWLSSESTEAEIAPKREMLEKIMSKMISDGEWKASKRDAKKQKRWMADHAASEFYNEVWLAASIISLRHSDPEARGAYDYVNSMFDERPNRPLFWNSLFRRLGYDAMIDNGTKMIYNLEPHQACFFHTGAIQTYQFFRNGPSEIYAHKKVIDSAQHFLRIVAKRDMSVRQTLLFVEAMLKGTDPGMESDNVPYHTYDKRIRLSDQQVRQVVQMLYDRDPDETEHAMGGAQIMRSKIWKIAGDLMPEEDW